MKLCLVLLILWCGLFATPEVQAAELPKPLRIAISNDSFPYMYLDSQNQPGGLVVDWWRALPAVDGRRIEFVAVDWTDIYQTLADGKADVIGGLAVTPERAASYLLGNPIAEVHSNVFIHRDLNFVNNLPALLPHLVGVVRNSGHLATIRQKQPDLVLQQFDHTSAMFDAALEGRIKAFIGLDRLTPRYGRIQQLSELYPLFKKIPLEKMQLTYALPKTSTALAAELQVLVAKLPATLPDKLQRRWLSGISSDDTIVVAMSVGNQPLMSMSSNGQPQGLLVDLWRLWSETTGIPIAIVPDTTTAGLTSLNQGRVDAHMGYPYLPDSRAEVQSVHPIYNLSSSFYYPKHQQFTDLNQVRSPIGFFAAAAYQKALRQDYPTLKFIAFDKLEDMQQALERREIAGFFGADLIMQQRLMLQQTDSYKILDFPKYQTSLQVLVREGNNELVNKIRLGFNALTQDQLETIEKRWVSLPELAYFARFRQQVPLTPEEQQWLAEHRLLKVGVMADWAPMEFVDQNGRFSGVTDDILQKLNQRLGTSFTAVPYQHWADLEADFAAGKLDVVANMSDLPERRKFAAFSHNFWPFQWTLISHNAVTEITALSQLKGKKVAVLQDYQIVKYFQANHPQVQLRFSKDLTQGLAMLQSGEVDFVVDTVISSGRALRQAENSNLRMHLPVDMPTYPSLFAVRKDWPELLHILDKGLKTLNESDRSEILDRWFSVEIHQGVDEGRVISLVLQVVGIGVVLLVLVFFWNMSLRREISLRRQMEEKMRFMATHDDLTKLANRNLLEERLNQALLQHARHHEKLALLFLDLDGFKEVNDQYGHHVGDELLVKVAEVLQHCVRKSDTVARFGGDEFVIMLTGLLDKDDAAIVAEKILLHLSNPLQLSACAARVGASIGIALYPDNGIDSQQMLKTADGLMYRAKQSGKGCYRFSHQGQ